MFYLDTETNQRYTPGFAFTYKGISYPKTAATKDKFFKLKFLPVIVDPKPDERFYVVEGPNDSGHYTSTEKDLAELKAKFVKDNKLAARALLEDTDWYIIRKVEKPSTTVPNDVQTFRAQVRTVEDTRTTQINACTSVAQLETLITAEVFVEDEPNGNMIQNTAALTAFPNQNASITVVY